MPRLTPPKAVRATRKLGVFGAWLLCGTLTLQASAQSPEGTYVASPAHVTARVDKWGEDCGVRPTSYTLKQQPKVPVLLRGKQLLLQFPSGALHTDKCWSKNPNLTVQTTRAEGGSWWTRCATPKGDPKSEAGVYEIVATDDRTLQLTESSRYDWQLKESHCVASVRIERTLERVGVAQGPSRSSAADESASTTAAKPSAEASDTGTGAADPLDALCVPGVAAKLRLSPAAVTAEPGQRVCFAARAADASGCGLQRPEVEWRVHARGHGKASMRGGCFRSAGSAAEGEDRYRITARVGTVSAHATVNVRTPDLSDITAHNVLAEASPLLQPSAEGTSPTPQPVETRVKAQSVPRDDVSWVWVLLAVAAALTLGAGAWLSTRQSGARKSAAPSQASSVPSEGEQRGEQSPRAEVETTSGASSEPMICPSCRHGYPPDTQRCTKDGTSLITYKSFNASTVPASQRACKDCGAAFKGDTVFCGKCGARLG